MKPLTDDETTRAETEKGGNDGIDRRNFLGCMAWAGTGLLWTFAGGVPRSRLLAQAVRNGTAAMHASGGDFSFVQISDSHIGFNKGANPNVTGTLQRAIERINVTPAGVKAALCRGRLTTVPGARSMTKNGVPVILPASVSSTRSTATGTGTPVWFRALMTRCSRRMS